MAAITAAVVVGGAAAYSANQQKQAAKGAANKQAKGVENAQAASKAAADKAIPIIGQGFDDSIVQLNNGNTLAQQNLLAGRNNSLSALTGGYDNAARSLNGGFDASAKQLNSGYDKSASFLNAGYDQAINEANSGFNTADQRLQTGFGDAINTLRPTSDQGNASSQLQAALSGALGPEAQAEAYKNYQASPGQQFLRDEQEQTLLRNEAALGGGLSNSGRVTSALQEQAAGRAMTDFDNSFNRLSQISARGDAANQSIASLQSNLGSSRANIQTQLAQILAGFSADRGNGLSSIEANRGVGLSGIEANRGAGLSNIDINRGLGVAGIEGDYGNNSANLNTSLAALLAQALQGKGISMGNAVLNQGSEQTQLAQNLGQARSSYDIYRSQNAAPISQGITAGVGAYTGMGGSSMLGGSMNQGSTQGGYTGNAYRNWVGGQ